MIIWGCIWHLKYHKSMSKQVLSCINTVKKSIQTILNGNVNLNTEDMMSIPTSLVMTPEVIEEVA